MAEQRTAKRRSFVEQRLGRLEHPGASARVGLADVSLRPRLGVKGIGTIGWMKRHAVTVPENDNLAVAHGAAMLVARLSPSEALLLDTGGGKVMERLAASLPPHGDGGAYPVPRMDTHGWFRLGGPDAPHLFAKLCAVDLRPEKFPNFSVAQTIAARLPVIIIRQNIKNAPHFHVLMDSASALYLWDCIVDAMAEFGGVVEADTDPRGDD
ncbi:MAG: sarcosine oxidase [Alphaproteobacteria bacterium]